MKKEYFLIACLLSLIVFALPLKAQTIERKVGKYILIDTDKNLGSVKDTLYIMRTDRNKKIEVGKAVIVKFNQGKTAAALKSGEAKTGDAVSRMNLKQIENMRASFESDHRSYYQIIKLYKGYVLIGPNSPFSQPNKTLVVKRNTPFGYIDVGSVKVIKTQNGNTAAKIVNEISPYSIEKGDVVSGKLVSNGKNVIDVFNSDISEDIDYYFFGPYNPSK